MCEHRGSVVGVGEIVRKHNHECYSLEFVLHITWQGHVQRHKSVEYS